MATRILDPTGETGRPGHSPAPGLSTLSGKRIGVLDNGKPNALMLMTEMATLLAKRSGATVTLVKAKRTAAEPATEELLEEFAREADLVLTGTADCGSCTSWSIHDVSSLENLGVAAIGVTTPAFEPISIEAAKTLGMDDVRLAVVTHPIGGISDSEVLDRASASIEQLLALALA